MNYAWREQLLNPRPFKFPIYRTYLNQNITSDDTPLYAMLRYENSSYNAYSNRSRNDIHTADNYLERYEYNLILILPVEVKYYILIEPSTSNSIQHGGLPLVDIDPDMVDWVRNQNHIKKSIRMFKGK